PILVGIIRPLILFPASTLAGISTEQLEMILLHELAHVRRWDNLINLIQRVIEAVLFFHPAVWWLSNRVRLEREHCCDVAVLTHISVPQDYAEMLVQMAISNTAADWVLGTSISHQLIPRIRRILKQEEDRMQVSRKMIVTSLSVLLSLAALTVANAQRDPIKSKAQPAAVAVDTKPNTASKKADAGSAKQGDGPQELDKVQEPLDPKQRANSIVISGTVFKLDGLPAGRSQVWLAGTTQLLGGRYGAVQVAFVRADDKGQFELWHPRWRDRNPQADEHAILWVFARTDDSQIAPSVSINLTNEYRDKTEIRGLELKASAKANYSGRVVDGKGTPIPNTKISPTHLVLPSTNEKKWQTMKFTDQFSTQFSTTTDSNGKFTLIGLPESITIFAKIAAPNVLAREVRWGTKTEPELRLEASGTIRGKITNLPASDFCEQVELLIKSVREGGIDQPQPQFTFSAKYRPKADGTFEISDVPPGSYELSISEAGSDWTIPQEFRIPVKCDSKSGQITENVQLALPSVITGRGRVVDDQSGAPIAGAKILFLKQQATRSYIGLATTDAKGEYRAYFLPGKIVIQPGKAPNEYLAPTEDRQNPAVEYTKDFEGPTFRYQRANTFRGTIVNEEGHPVPGAEIRWFQPSRQGQGLPRTITSDESGRFEIPQIDPQDALPIRVRSPQGASTAVLLQPNELVDPKPILVSPKNAFRVKGTLTNQRGRPVPNVTVAVHWHRRYVSEKTRMAGMSGEIEKVKTNEQGEFESSGFWDTDRYHVVIEADGFPRMDLPQVAGESGRTHDYGKVQLRGTSVSISGKVVDSSGKPMSQVTVFNSGDAADVVTTMTDDKGRFQLSGLLDGPVYIFAEHAKYRMAGTYTSDPSKEVVLTLIPSSDPPAPRSELNLESLDAIRQQNAKQLTEWIKANNLALVPNLRDHRFNALARTDPDEALKQIKKQSKAMDQQSALVIARSLTPEQPRKKEAYEKDAQAVKTALRFVERAASLLGDVSGNRQLYMKADIGLMFLRLGDAERGKVLIESAAKEFSESKNPTERYAANIAQGLAWYDVPRALSYQDKVKEQHDKVSFRKRVIFEVARYNVPRALELLNDPTLKKGMESNDDGLKLDLAYRIGKVEPQVASKLVDSIVSFRTKAEAAGWTAVAVAGENPALAESLIDQAMETLQAHRTPGSQTFYYEWLPAVAANLAVQATSVKHHDMESIIQRVLALRIPADKGTSSVSRYQSTVNAALYLAFIEPDVAKRLLADLEPELISKMLGNGGIESVGMNQWLCAWVVADPEHATVLMKAEMEKSRGSKEPPYWIANAYTLLCLPKAEQLEFVREYGNAGLVSPYVD
ncbi:MAG: blaR1 6, partial [Planctomycetaceae bacterium]|nr:blaR1 6 [Planctomycetaceae bacterium]